MGSADPILVTMVCLRINCDSSLVYDDHESLRIMLCEKMLCKPNMAIFLD